MKPVIWTVRAVDDVTAIRAYIEQFSPLASLRFAARLINAANGLCDQPERGRRISGGRRELTIITPYLIQYRVLEDRVEVLAIRHGAREVDG